MRFITALLIMITLLLTGCASRPAGNYGFGVKPEVGAVRNAIAGHLNTYLHHPDSLSYLSIAKPEPGCFRRGPGLRDICGYKVCFEYRVLTRDMRDMVTERQALWITNGFGNLYREAQDCSGLISDWNGKSPVETGNFCALQPQNTECLNGRSEPYPADLRAPDSPSGPATMSSTKAYKSMRLDIWRPATEEDIQALAAAADIHLKDGPSARYQSVKVGLNPDAPSTNIYCGMINSKNSFGAYIGFKRFFFAEVGFLAIEDDFNGGFLDKKCK